MSADQPALDKLRTSISEKVTFMSIAGGFAEDELRLQIKGAMRDYAYMTGKAYIFWSYKAGESRAYAWGEITRTLKNNVGYEVTVIDGHDEKTVNVYSKGSDFIHFEIGLTHGLYHNGKLHSKHPDYNSAWMQLVDAQGQSTEYAIRYGGWSIRELEKK